MAMFAISKKIFRRFYSCSSRLAIIGSQTKSSYLLTHFDSLFDSKHQRYYCSNEKWITIILEKVDGTRVERKGKTGDALYAVLHEDPDFPGYGVCKATQGCSTCHVIFTKQDYNTISKYNKQSDNELDLLDDIANKFSSSDADFRTDTSRLGCCIVLVPEMDGMLIKIAKSKSLTNT
ncbi:hypothetical protein AVEN_116868-1 [Araneus ventricosus]|uniref:Uncharacterized protein n=1 Tax=Araneus ventricosus TaxID=182803 RepID=A0A4Y2LVT1_ARAVE|nr:hypothetical protein AVEN_116868-1 [Araneus ventricosus]